MPAYLTHRAAAGNVFKKIASGIEHEKAFCLGSQGPDLLFFRNFQPWRSSKVSLGLGIAMHHENVRQMFEHGFEYVRNYQGDDRDELVSYMAGMVVHYAIDKNAHPYVYKKSGTDSALHNRIEFMWDSIVAEDTWGIRADEYNFREEIDYAKICGGIREWYTAVAEELYGTKIKPRIIREAQKHYATVKQSLNNVKLPGRIALWFASNVLKFDTRSLMYEKEISFNLFSKEEYEDMKKMIEKGVNEAVQMVRFALEYFKAEEPVKLPEWFGDLDFSGTAK